MADISALEGSPRHSQHIDETETVVFNDCIPVTGLGIKIIGGKSDLEGGRDYGIFIHRVIPGGLAEQRGCLREGDQILSVNGESLLRVTNDEAVQYLGSASATNRVTLVITRSVSALHQFSLLESQLANTRNSFSLDSQSVSSDQGSETQEQMSPASRPCSSQGGITSTRSPSPSLGSAASILADQNLASPKYLWNTSTFGIDSRKCTAIELTLKKLSGLGLSVSGGVDRVDGPGIHIQRILPDGDCHRNGKLGVGDQLVSVNGEDLTGITIEAAIEILTRASCRIDEDTLRISYVPAACFPFFVVHSSSHTPNSNNSSPSLTNLNPPGQQGPRLAASGHGGHVTASPIPQPVVAAPIPNDQAQASQHLTASEPRSSQGGITSTRSPSPSLGSAASIHNLKSTAHEIVLKKVSGLGLSISGGVDRVDGPGIHIQRILPDGDCYRNGQLRVGDQLVSVNGQPLTGITNEAAIKILTRALCRIDKDTLRISYVPAASFLSSIPQATPPTPTTPRRP